MKWLEYAKKVYHDSGSLSRILSGKIYVWSHKISRVLLIYNFKNV